jgi:hypothetical protein
MKKLLILAALLFYTTAQALIETIDVYRDPETDQLLLMANDLHVDGAKFKNTKKQQRDALAWIKQLNGHITVEEFAIEGLNPAALGLDKKSPLWVKNKDAITEYVHSMGSAARHNPSIFATDNKIKLVPMTDQKIDPANYAHLPWHTEYSYSTMFGLTAQCQKLGIPFDNVECRHLSSIPNTTAAQVIAADNALIQMIRSWKSDPEPLQKFYAAAIAYYHEERFTKFLKKNLKVDRPVHALTNNSAFGRETFDDNETNLHNTCFLDAVLLHKIHTAHHAPLILSLCGCAHHERIKPILEDIGFEHVKRYGQQAWSREADSIETILPILNLDQVFHDLSKTMLRPPNSGTTSDYLTPFYRTVTTGQLPLGSFLYRT